VVEVAQRGRAVALSEDPSWRSRIDKSAGYVEDAWRSNRAVYGVTTGFGDSVVRPVSPDLAAELQLHLTRFHGCGMGRHLDAETARAVVAARLVSLGTGYSGVRPVVLQRICDLLNHGITPLIPEEGSVGASGDLTPLSYVAAALFGEREVLYKGDTVPALDALADTALEPIKPSPKEALSIMNGTCAMTGMACLAFSRARYLSRVACRITAMAVEALRANKAHFDERIFAAKPHEGQAQAASQIRSDCGYTREYTNGFSGRLQAPYSIRCAPHVIGVLTDALPWIRTSLETELNSANDNPLVDPDTGDFLHGGNFYGGHVAFAMDSMKNAVANVADLLDRQLAVLVDPKTNNGLPPNLSGATEERASVNHGLKAVQIAVSAWTAEALKLTVPASVFSRSTECHNQDKVSMGTISARDCLRVLELSEQVTAASLLAASQGVELRLRRSEIDEGDLTPAVRDTHKLVLDSCGFVDEDRPLEQSLRGMCAAIRRQECLPEE
jgi:histidine ammonia-lyase